MLLSRQLWYSVRLSLPEQEIDHLHTVQVYFLCETHSGVAVMQSRLVRGFL
jgi:hypothetical protein